MDTITTFTCTIDGSSGYRDFYDTVADSSSSFEQSCHWSLHCIFEVYNLLLYSTNNKFVVKKTTVLNLWSQYITS